MKIAAHNLGKFENKVQVKTDQKARRVDIKRILKNSGGPILIFEFSVISC